jgi:hypothetical protein
MSCPHGNPIGDCDICDEIDAAFEAGRQSALAEQPAPAQPLTDEQITAIYNKTCKDWTNRYDRPVVFARAIEAAHNIKENT